MRAEKDHSSALIRDYHDDSRNPNMHLNSSSINHSQKRSYSPLRNISKGPLTTDELIGAQGDLKSMYSRDHASFRQHSHHNEEGEPPTGLDKRVLVS